MIKSELDLKIAHKLVGLSHRCKDKDIEFDLTFSFLKNKYSRKTCEYTGLRFDNNNNKRSLERINSNKGYTEDNVLIVIERINQAKSDFTEKELESILKAIKKHKKLMKENDISN